ncbi:DUF6046 domain-containing protein [Flavobacterium sp. LB2P6]
MENQDILFASLVGSKVIKMIPRLTSVQNELMKHVLPPIPFLPFTNENGVEKPKVSALESTTWQADFPLDESQQFFPLSLSIDNGKNWFRLPYEPLISISGKNVIAKRRVAKWNSENSTQLTGTIKERWSQDDYDITITGVLMGAFLRGSVEDCFPRADFQKLKKVLSYAKHIKVACPPLELLGINSIVVDDFSFPFTKGENVQAYEIKVCSDFSYNLLMEI